MLQYYGIYRAAPARGGRLAERRRRRRRAALSFKIVRPSTVTVTLTAPNGAIASQETGSRDPGTYDVAFPPAALPPPTGRPPTPDGAAPARRGTVGVNVSASDDQGLPSTATRAASR